MHVKPQARIHFAYLRPSEVSNAILYVRIRISKHVIVLTNDEGLDEAKFP